MSSINEEIESLFNCDFFADDFDPEGREEHLALAEDVLSKYLWEDIFSQACNYLINTCDSVDEVFNFANLYYYYGFCDKPVANPYEFLGYINLFIGSTDGMMDFCDDFCIAVLSTCGLIDLNRNPYYRSWEDPMIATATDVWRKKLSKSSF